MLNKQAQEKLLSAKIKTAILEGDEPSIRKYASGASDLLMFYTYTQGHARRIFGGLNGEVYEKINQDDKSIIWDPVREEATVRYFLQPEYKQVGESAMPVQSWGGPYLKRISSGVMEGNFSKLQSDKVIKKVEEIAAYPFDIMEFAKDQTVKQILSVEDYAMYSAFNNLVRETETELANRSIYACYKSTFDHHDVINSMEMHISSRKRNQPKEFLLLPETMYHQFAKIDQQTIDGLSRRFYDDGFGDKSNTVLYDNKAVRVDDSSYADFEAGQDADISKFGSEFNDDAAGRLAMYQAAGYDIAVLGDLLTKYNIDPTVVTKFTRSYFLPPKNFLGKALLWGADMKTTLKYEDEYVSFYSTEWLAFLFHNKYAVTCLDAWS